MKIYFVRHGESEANVLQVISNRGRVHGLTERGRQQAEDLAGKLKGASAVRIFTSPLLRAVETAEILARELGLEFEVTDALREFDCGIVEGKSDPASWEVLRRLLTDWFVRGQPESRIEGGESLLDIRQRFVPFIDGLLAEYRDHAVSLILVGHGGTIRATLPFVLTNVSVEFMMEHPMANTGYIVAESTPEGLRCQEWCGIRVAEG